MFNLNSIISYLLYLILFSKFWVRKRNPAFILKASTGSRASFLQPHPRLQHQHPLSRPGSGTMDDVPPIIQLSIALRVQPNEGPVFFKVDGTRFGQTRTIKLLTGSKYKIEVVAKPGSVEAT